MPTEGWVVAQLFASGSGNVQGETPNIRRILPVIAFPCQQQDVADQGADGRGRAIRQAEDVWRPRVPLVPVPTLEFFAALDRRQVLDWCRSVHGSVWDQKERFLPRRDGARDAVPRLVVGADHWPVALIRSPWGVDLADAGVDDGSGPFRINGVRLVGLTLIGAGRFATSRAERPPVRPWSDGDVAEVAWDGWLVALSELQKA